VNYSDTLGHLKLYFVPTNISIQCDYSFCVAESDLLLRLGALLKPLCDIRLGTLQPCRTRTDAVEALLERQIKLRAVLSFEELVDSLDVLERREVDERVLFSPWLIMLISVGHPVSYLDKVAPDRRAIKLSAQSLVVLKQEVGERTSALTVPGQRDEEVGPVLGLGVRLQELESTVDLRLVGSIAQCCTVDLAGHVG